MVRSLLIVCVLFFSLHIFAANYYCNPASGDINNSGSIDNPWSTMKDVFDANKIFESGDTLFLYGGDHGTVDMFGNNTNYVIIKAVNGEEPVLESLRISNPYWRFEGIHVSSYNPAGTDVYDKIYLVQSTTSAHHIYFDSCSIYSTDSINEDVSGWTRDNWFLRTRSGLNLLGKNSYIYNCHVKNTNFAVSISGDYSEVANNVIENIVGDGIRAVSSHSLYEYNLVKNFYEITGTLVNPEDPDNPGYGIDTNFHIGIGNHDDLFQSFTTPENPITNVTVRYNTFISHDHVHFDMSPTQGIGCFDGFFYDWVVENNIIITDNFHGITFLGIYYSIIANNTVLYNPIGGIEGNHVPWIWIGKHKNDGESYFNIVRNNLVTRNPLGLSHTIRDDGKYSTIEDNHIITLSKVNDYFIDFTNYDVHLKTGALAIDVGKNLNLPINDIDKNHRLVGPYVDCGAYEFNDGSASSNCPMITPIDDYKVEETMSIDIDISTTNIGGNTVIISTNNLPNFMTLTDNGDGSAVLNVSPLVGDYGSTDIELTAADAVSSNTRTFKVKVEKTTVGVNNIDGINQLNVYPNPLSLGSNLHIQMLSNTHAAAQVTVYDIAGKIMYSGSITPAGGVFTINTSNIANSGVYIVNILGENQLFFIK